MRLRTPPGLVLQSTPNGLSLVDPIANRSLPETDTRQAGLLALLAECRDWHEESEIAALLARRLGVSKGTAEASVMALAEAGLLERSDDHAYALERLPEWRHYNWEEPFLLQWHLNHHPKLDYSTDGERLDREKMRRIVAEEPLPSNYKDFVSERSEELPEALGKRVHKDVESVFRHRVSISSGASLDRETLSWFLRLAFGQTFRRELHVTGEHVAKTSPSGGSRHPIEVYPILLDVEGVAPGVYHYSVRHHRLAQIASGDFSQFVVQALVGHPQRPDFKPKVALVYTCIFERSMYRYRDARSYRVMQHDLGHLMQTAAMVASSAGLASYRGYTLDERATEKLLRIDGLMESAFAFCVIG